MRFAQIHIISEIFASIRVSNTIVFRCLLNKLESSSSKLGSKRNCPPVFFSLLLSSFFPRFVTWSDTWFVTCFLCKLARLEVSFFVVFNCSLPVRKYITDVLLEKGSAQRVQVLERGSAYRVQVLERGSEYFASRVFMSSHVRIYVIHPLYIAKALNYTIHVYGIQSFNTVFQHI